MRDPDDLALQEVYADWLEQAGDRRAAFIRPHLELSPLPPDYPDRIAREAELSRLRVGIEPAWLRVIEPERAYHYARVLALDGAAPVDRGAGTPSPRATPPLDDTARCAAAPRRVLELGIPGKRAGRSER